MEDKILALFDRQDSWTLRSMEKALHLKEGREFTKFIQTLNDLEERRILYNDHHAYYLITQEEYFVGRVKDISRWEFAVTSADGKIYVKKKFGKNAFDRDVVLVHVTPEKNEIVKIYEHEIQMISGVFKRTKKGMIFFSDIDFHRPIKITNLKDFKPRPKDKAVLAIEAYTNPLQAKLVKLIPDDGKAGNDITTMLYTQKVRMEFNDKVRAEVEKLPTEVKPDDRIGRTDFRNLYTVTIDGDDAKDFDDAISIEKNEQGYVLYVHIADVSHYVKEGSAIDQEAYLRSTSIYVCDRVIPMLPFELSNGICSLNPHVDRCTQTCRMQMDQNGRCIAYEIMPSVIHSDHRCTYRKVNAVMAGDPDAQEEYADVLPLIENLKELTLKMKERAKERGTIDFETKEAVIQLNQKGFPVDIYEKKRGFAEEMIEQCMIQANVCVANFLHQNHLPCMYRVHETPDPEKAATICTVARVMNQSCDLYPDEVSAKDIQQFLLSIEDPHAKDVLSLVALRAMQKARYDAKCLGHFGLALEEYCHFTSPIRRYSDLVVHRMLRKYHFEHADRIGVHKDEAKIEKQSYYVSLKEKDAIHAERSVDDYKKAEYMSKRIGKKFKGTIVGVMNFGFFVELDNTVEGLVPLHSLVDHYDYDEVRMCLIGQNSHRLFALGQEVDVLCYAVNLSKGQVEFALC